MALIFQEIQGSTIERFIWEIVGIVNQKNMGDVNKTNLQKIGNKIPLTYKLLLSLCFFSIRHPSVIYGSI